MIIKCPKCGLEYSYGRNLCHVCENNTILFGAFFKAPRKAYQWNCDTKLGCIESSLKESDSYEDLLEVTSEKKEKKIEEILQ